MRLGVSPAAAPTPRDVFNQRFEALFPCAGALGFVVCLAPRRHPGYLCVVHPGYLCANVGMRGATHRSFSTALSLALLVYLCANVGPQGLQVVRLLAPFVPHSASVGPAMATGVLSTPAARLSPSYRSG